MIDQTTYLDISDPSPGFIQRFFSSASYHGFAGMNQVERRIAFKFNSAKRGWSVLLKEIQVQTDSVQDWHLPQQ